ncbi:MAG: protein archease [Candidatus Tectimicrobiota bacterium]|nr:MAG: protein archease [Candidatus Tectomicrobia bacterium]
MPFAFLDDVAIADLAFEAWGETLEETFVAAAEAVLCAMVEDPQSVRPQVRRPLRLRHEALDLLLFTFLQELIYYKDAEQLLLRVPQVRLGTADGVHTLEAEACGERLDPSRHQLRVDVKAVTLHRFSLAQTPSGWKACVVLDV